MPESIDRREFLTLLGAGALATSLPSWAVPSQERKKPNIIVIVADDLGRADLGVYGCRDIPTPNIDSIGRNGVRFTSGYVSCPVCSPTRAGLQTGRYQQRFGHEFNPGPQVDNAKFGLAADEVTIAERLKAAGYTTGLVGKWHLGNKLDSQPTSRGYDEFFGFLGGAHAYLPAAAAAPIYRGTKQVREPGYLTEAFGREADAFIERHKAKPFFLMVTFNAVHTPLQAPQKYLDRFSDIKDTRRRTMAAMLSAMDDAVGTILRKLRAIGVEDDTLVFFIADNGGPTNSNSSRNVPFSGFKGQVQEGGIRVPFMVQWKRQLPRGKVYDQPVIALDIHATCLAAAGIAAPTSAKRLDGTDIAPYLGGKKVGAPHEALFWRFGVQWAVRKGRYKLVGSVGGPRLYDLTADPGEKNDLSKARPQTVAELQKDWNDWNATLKPPAWGRSPGPRQRRRLRQSA